MSSDDALLPGLPQDPTLLADLTKPSSLYLTRISLLQGSSDPVKLKKPKTCPPDCKTFGDNCKVHVPQSGQFAIGFGDKTRIMLECAEGISGDGSDFRAVVGPFRPHALYMKDKKVQEETFRVNDVYKKIEALEKKFKKAKPQNEVANAGLDVLFYLPDYNLFATFFFKGSYKDEAKSVGAMSGKLVRFSSYFVPSDTFGGWHKPKIELIGDGNGGGVVVDEKARKDAFEAFVAGRDEQEPEAGQPADLNSAVPPR